MTKKELIGCIGGIILIISAFFGVYRWFEAEFAHAGDLMKAMEVIQKIGIRLDYKIVEDQLRATQQKIRTIEDEYCPDKSKPCDESKMPKIVRDQYRELKTDKEKLEQELKDLKAKK